MTSSTQTSSGLAASEGSVARAKPKGPSTDAIRAQLQDKLQGLKDADVNQMIDVLAERAALNVFNAELSSDKGEYIEDPRLRASDGTLVKSGSGAEVYTGERGETFGKTQEAAREAMAEFVPAYLEAVRQELSSAPTPEVAQYAASMEKLDTLKDVFAGLATRDGGGPAEVELSLSKVDFPLKASAIELLAPIQEMYDKAEFSKALSDAAQSVRTEGLSPATLEKIESLNAKSAPEPGSFAEAGLLALNTVVAEANSPQKTVTPDLVALLEEGGAAAAASELDQANSAFAEYGSLLSEVLKPVLAEATAAASQDFDKMSPPDKDAVDTIAAFTVREALAGRIPDSSASLDVVREELGPDAQRYSDRALSQALGADLVQQIARDGLPQAAVAASQSVLQDQADLQGLGGVVIDRVTATAALGEAMAVSGQSAVLNIDVDSGQVHASASGDPRGLVVDAEAVREPAELANDQAHESAQRGVRAREADEGKQQAAAEAEMSMEE